MVYEYSVLTQFSPSSLYDCIGFSLPGNVKREKKQAEREEWDEISYLSANT